MKENNGSSLPNSIKTEFAKENRDGNVHVYLTSFVKGRQVCSKWKLQCTSSS